MTKIEKYTAYFHDGGLTNIKNRKNEVKFFISSAEVDKDDVPDFYLTRKRLKGTLILKHVRKTEENKKTLTEPLKMLTEFGEILDLEIIKLRNALVEVKMYLRWCTSKKKFGTVAYSDIKIIAEEISWETYIPRKRKPKTD